MIFSMQWISFNRIVLIIRSICCYLHWNEDLLDTELICENNGFPVAAKLAFVIHQSRC